jgi:coenzyme F420 hydrogenase subunit beta
MWTPDLAAAPARHLCTDCGLSRTDNPQRCGQACQFIQPDYTRLEMRVHGRSRAPTPSAATLPDTLFFGPHLQMLQASLAQPAEGAQWSGITTRIAEKLLRSGEVDAVITMTADPGDRWRPLPVVITDPDEIAQCRGMRMGYAPLVALIEPALKRGLRRLAVVAIPCQVYALRAIQPELEKSHGLLQLTVIGIPCSDNTTTERFHEFLALVSPHPEDVVYLEFCADYHVEIRTRQGEVRRLPFLSLPLSDLPVDFFPMTCRTCVDYTNTLSDITVGYMGGRGEQWLIVRNARGQALLDLLGDELRAQAPSSAGNRLQAVKGFLKNVERASGGLPLRKMPAWLRPLVSWLMPRIGPRGLEFARARVEMKAIESVLHLRREAPQRLKNMLPPHVWQLAERYGIHPLASEKKALPEK